MTQKLLIVESPAKAQTINKYLGKDFKVLASYGHVRDLVKKNGAVDPEHGFSMRYELVDRNKKHVDAIAREAKKSDAIYLATDLDREGEAISWHICEILKEKNLLKDKPVYRVVFSEITPKAVKESIDHPRTVSMELVNAQQARRALDYLVGFNLSPLLWRKVNPGLSAGRVQSPALRMIVEREAEIDKFVPREYWHLETPLEKDKTEFTAKLWTYEKQKLKQFDIENEQQANGMRSAIIDSSGGTLTVKDIQKKQRKRNPAPPFITSTLQQEAARKLGFTTQRTMRIAQQLYEGIDIGGSQQGLITYMRTDSLHLANDALAELRSTIEKHFGADMLPEKPNFFKTKSKNAQEAHEAIRPTSSSTTPQSLKTYLSSEQFKLYELIWKRTLACQMTHATLDTVTVDLDAGNGHIFRASGTTVRIPGFLSVYEEGQDDKKDGSDTPSKLPTMETGDKFTIKDLKTIQHFTEPPPRFTEASLVKALEEYGIGRPSTYANIISTLLNREYVELERKRFTPTTIGKVVNHFLSTHFTNYVDYEFTAEFEDELDAISRGEKDWIPLLDEFWQAFDKLVKEKSETVSRAEANLARELGTDPESGKPVIAKYGKYGPFVQIGTREDEEKPRFASLRQGQQLDRITLEEALKLFELPRKLGTADDGEEVLANIGRFGPYVKQGKTFASLGELDPYEVTFEQAVDLIRQRREFEANRIIKTFPDSDVQILNGRWGAYITDGSKNAKIPKDQEPAELTLETCTKLLAEAPERKSRRKKVSKKKVAKKTSKKTSKKKAGKKKATGSKA